VCWIQVLLQKLGDQNDLMENVTIRIVKGGDTIEVGRRAVQCISAATPRYPELLCLYERTTRKLFSSCLFSAHVNPQKGVVGTDGYDKGGWEVYSSDWRFFFDCMFAPVARQTSGTLQKLDLQVSRKRAAEGQSLGAWLKSLFGSDSNALKAGSRPVAIILPRHGPIARQSVTQLVNAYIEYAPPQYPNCADVLAT
jgi:flavorubredoxin